MSYQSNNHKEIPKVINRDFSYFIFNNLEGNPMIETDCLCIDYNQTSKEFIEYCNNTQGIIATEYDNVLKRVFITFKKEIDAITTVYNSRYRFPQMKIHPIIKNDTICIINVRDEEDLKKHIEKLSKFGEIVYNGCYFKNGVAFIKFKYHSDAKKALESANSCQYHWSESYDNLRSIHLRYSKIIDDYTFQLFEALIKWAIQGSGYVHHCVNRDHSFIHFSNKGDASKIYEKFKSTSILGIEVTGSYTKTKCVIDNSFTIPICKTKANRNANQILDTSRTAASIYTFI